MTSSASGKEYVVGIDTGGTYTDGVLLDYCTRQVLASAKTPTTYESLAKGINKVLQELNIPEPSQVKLVGISSTLATNSIAEGRIRRVGLILIGYDSDLISIFNLQARFATSHFAYFAGGHNAQGMEQDDLDVQGIQEWTRNKEKDLDALAISSYFSPLNSSHELRAYQAVREITEIPVVLGHQLSTRLDSVKRATTVSLNASLIAVMHEFIQAVKQSLQKIGIPAPLMIVKGDGSLMSYQEAVQKPVETILSGPAASAIGGHFLSGESSALMIDVGGTTTDMALLEKGHVDVSDDGARVGQTQTAVRAARIRTACLGCDSRINILSAHEFSIGPDRVMPLCRLAFDFPEVEKEIAALRKLRKRNLHDVQYLFLTKELEAESLPASGTHAGDIIKLLKKGPKSVSSLMLHTGTNHPVQLGVEDMIQNGYVGRSALTATDLLHVQGLMDTWRTESARQALDYICKIHDIKSGPLLHKIIDSIVEQMVKEVIIFLAGKTQPDSLPEEIDGRWGEWFFRQSMRAHSRYLCVDLRTPFPIIGIGAPAEIFVKEIAEHLNTDFILPPNHHVANAAGAVAGSVVVSTEAIIYRQQTENNQRYVVNLENENKTFANRDEAKAYAEKKVREASHDKAKVSGVKDVQLQTQTASEGGLLRITVRAVGNPGLFISSSPAEHTISEHNA